MPAESGIYWDSIDSQRSASAGSSGECSTGSTSRHYVDPWDLENYAYLRRHSVAGISQTQQPPRRASRRLSRDSRARSDYWCPSREPGYVAPAFVEELYHGPPPRTTRQPNNARQYQQARIYEDDVPDYVATYPVYAPLSELREGEIDEHKRTRYRLRSPSIKDFQRSEYLEPRIRTRESVNEHDSSRTRKQEETYASTLIREENYVAGMVPPSRLDLNTYGHLRIDYTDSWNSLNRKISKS